MWPGDVVLEGIQDMMYLLHLYPINSGILPNNTVDETATQPFS